jgi:glycosyltransferase involved in cell wall biosynthesis
MVAAFRSATVPRRMRVCIAYDCLYPWTVGGHERYLRELAEELSSAGHDVTYVTRRQWSDAERPSVPGVKVVGVSREEPLYDDAGRRRIAETIHYGAGVLRHLLRHRRAYDVVHLVSFPYFSVPAARLALAGSGRRVLVDWPEVWSRAYWREYVGRFAGTVGFLVQAICARLTPEAFVFSDLHAARLRDEGLRGPATRLPGPLAGDIRAHPAPMPEQPLVLFAGRMIAEKRATVVPAAIAAARERIPGLRGLVIGDGPERAAVQAEIARRGLEDVVDVPGFVSGDEVDRALERATCLLAPSSREGFGIVAIEASAAATPAIVARAPDNAMVERIEEGVNGFVVDDADPALLAEAIVRCHEGGQALRDSTAAWFAREAPRLTGQAAMREVERRYLAQ